MKKRWKEIRWPDFVRWLSGKTLAEEINGECAHGKDYSKGAVILVFTDGSRARVQSEYDGPYSDVTPGNGIEMPTVEVEEDA